MAMPKYQDIPIDPQYGKPEYFKDWVAVILELIKGIKGTNNYYDLTPMTILEIIGDNSEALSLSDLTELINTLNSNNDATSEELSNLGALLDQLSNKLIEISNDVTNIIQEINNNIKPDIADIFNKIVDINNRLDILEELTKEENVDNNILANKLRIIPIKYIRVRMNGGSFGNQPTDSNYLALLNAYDCLKEKIPVNIVSSSAGQFQQYPFNNLVDDDVNSLAMFGSAKQWCKIELNKVYDNVEFIEITVKDNEYVNLEGIDISEDGNKWLTVCKSFKLTNTDDGRTQFSRPIGRRIYINDRRAYVDDQLEILTDQVITLKNDVKNIKEKVGTLEDLVQSHGEKIYNLETRMNTAEENIKNVTNTANATRDRLDNLVIGGNNLVNNSANILVPKSGDPYPWNKSQLSGFKCYVNTGDFVPIKFECNHPVRAIVLNSTETPISTDNFDYQCWCTQRVLGSDTLWVGNTFTGIKVSGSVMLKPDVLSNQYTAFIMSLKAYDSGNKMVGIKEKFISYDQLNTHKWWWKTYNFVDYLEIPNNAQYVDLEFYITNKGSIQVACPYVTIGTQGGGWQADAYTTSLIKDGGRVMFIGSSNPADHWMLAPGDIWLNV